MSTDTLPSPVLRIPHGDTRSLLFTNNGQVIVRVPDDAWIAFDLRNKRTRCIPMSGTHATLLGHWMFVGGMALDLRDGQSTPEQCEIEFDIDPGFRSTAIACAGTSVAAFVRGGRLCIRKGTPDTIDDRQGWEYRSDFSSNMRLLVSADQQYVIGCNYGASLDLFHMQEGKLDPIDHAPEGHPTWASAHPVDPVVAVFSRVLSLVDLRIRLQHVVLQLPHKTAGEYLPNGALLFSTELGLMVLHEGRVRLVMDLAYEQDRPVRVSPDGRYVALGGTELLIFESSSLLR